MKAVCFSFLALLLLSCNRIETGTSLSPGELVFIRGTGLLDEGEAIHQFYSNFTLQKAGSFFTDKRMARYWLDGRDTGQHRREYALYRDITAVDPVFTVPDFGSPNLQVRRKDQTTFRLYMDGSPGEMQLFYQEALGAWKRHRYDRR